MPRMWDSDNTKITVGEPQPGDKFVGVAMSGGPADFQIMLDERGVDHFIELLTEARAKFKAHKEKPNGKEDGGERGEVL